MKNTQTTAVIHGSLPCPLCRCVPGAEQSPGSSGQRLRTIRDRGRFILAIALCAFSWLVAPTRASATGGVACQLQLNWVNNDSTVDGFMIERATSLSGPWTQIAQVLASPTSYQDTAVVPNGIYYYRLRAYNEAGDSGYSNVASGSAPCLGATDSVGDGIADLWRQAYFGGSGTTTNNQSCASCDADGTGQNNQFKYVAGLDPTNPDSVFVLEIQSVAGQPSHRNLIFNPVGSGRTYTIESRTNLLSGSYAALGGFSGPQTNANQVTVTDLNATQSSKFYRVHVSLP
jgi:hypothetical protein